MNAPLLERLALLAEECAEVQQRISKILRFGMYSHNPKDPSKTTNKEILENELGDLLFAFEFLVENKDIDMQKVKEYRDIKRKTIQPFLVHNKVR